MRSRKMNTSEAMGLAKCVLLGNSTIQVHCMDEDENEGYRESMAVRIPMTLVYITVFITGIVGNVCTCLVIAFNKYMHTATNYYLFSLAVSDLLLLVLGLPHELFHLWASDPYPFGELVCVLRGLAAETSTNATILTITAFTVERYVAICHPLRSRTMSKLSRAFKLIITIWLGSCACAVPIALQFGITYAADNPDPSTAACTVKNPLPNAFELSTFIFFCLPMTVISVLYVLIAIRLKKPHPRQGVAITPEPVIKMLGEFNSPVRSSFKASNNF